MTYEKQTWISYDDNKTEELNTQNGAVVTAERMNHLETGLDEHDKNTTNPHKVTKAQVGLGNVSNVEQATKTEFDSHASSKTNPHSVTASQVGAYSKVESENRYAKPSDITKDKAGLGNVDNFATATRLDAEQGIAPNKFMTPMGVKQHVDSRIATTEEAGTGERNDVLITPKRLIETLKQYTLFKEHFGKGEELKDNTTDGVLLKIGESLGGSINYDTARPYKINTDGSLTFNKDGRFRFSGSAKLVAGDTNPTDYMYTQIVVGSTINDWINQGSSKATNGTMRLTWTFAGSIILDVNSGNRVYIRSSIRSGKQAFLAQLMELTIEEVRFSG